MQKKMRFNNLTKLFVFIFISLVISSCGDGVSNKTEGVIEYKVSYPKMEKDNFMRDFMPEKMIVKFKDNTYTNNLSAGMGMFKSSFICSKENNEYIQLVKLLNKQYAMKLNKDEIAKSMASKPKYTIEFTNEVKEILGFHCTKAIVNMNNEAQDAFTVFYTENLNIENPNWCNEFVDIPGVMLEYQYEKYGVCMRFTADKIEYSKINDEEFQIPNGYKLISEPEMDKEMKEIFDSFN